jgi:hypothetical protein
MATLNMARRSPVAIPKSYLGRGLDRPETPEADNEDEASDSSALRDVRDVPLHMPNTITNHVILPQSYNRHRASSTAVTDLAASWLC